MTKKLDVLKQKKQQIEAQIKELQARERTKQRKLETRRKIILGGALLAVEQQQGASMTIADVLEYARQTAQKEKDKTLCTCSKLPPA